MRRGELTKVSVKMVRKVCGQFRSGKTPSEISELLARENALQMDVSDICWVLREHYNRSGPYRPVKRARSRHKWEQEEEGMLLSIVDSYDGQVSWLNVSATLKARTHGRVNVTGDSVRRKWHSLQDTRRPWWRKIF